MIRDLGIVKPGATLYLPFHTFDSNDPAASVSITGLAATDIEIYKDGGTTQRASDSGYALLDTDGTDFDGVTGIHGISIDLADNTTAGFYAAGSQYWVVVSSITVDAATINFVLATFTIGYADALLNTTLATLASQTSFTLTSGPADDDALNGCVALVHDVADGVQIAMGIVSDYTGSSKTVTLAVDPGIFTMVATDNVSFLAPSSVVGWNTVPLSTTNPLPNASADAAGGLPISDAGGLDLDTQLAETNEITAARMGALTDWINDGRLDAILDTIAADVVNVDGAAMRGTDNAALASSLTTVAGTIATLDALLDKILSYHQLALRSDAAIATDRATELGEINANEGSGAGDYAQDADSQEALRDHVGDGTNLTEAGGDGDHLTAIDLPNQTMDITGNLSGSVGSVTGAVGSVTGAINTAAGTITTLDGLDTAQDTQHASTQSDIASVASDVTTLLGRITSTLFAGITSLAEWLGLLAGKQAGDATALTELKATGAGSGTFDESTESLEALRDYIGDGTNLTEAGGTGDQLTALATAAALTTVDSIVDSIEARLPAALTGAGNMKADTLALDGSTAAATNLKETAETIATGVCDSGGSTTSIVTSSLDPAVSATDQLKGKIVTFERDTTTAALRSQSTDITASTSAGVLTVTALTDAPVSGDTFSVT